jgi:hypothetical protein
VLDLAMFKNLRLTERWTLQFRAEAFNFPNSPSLGNPAANISFPQNVGRIRASSVAERSLQFALKVLF